MQAAPDALTNLPPDIRFLILSLLPKRDLCHAAQVSKRFYALASSDRLWRPADGARFLCETLSDTKLTLLFAHGNFLLASPLRTFASSLALTVTHSSTGMMQIF